MNSPKARFAKAGKLLRRVSSKPFVAASLRLGSRKEELGASLIHMSNTKTLSVAFIGAGGVNFGGVDPGSPWDHASRLEALSDEFPIRIVGISDLDAVRLNLVHSQRTHKIFEGCKTFSNFIEMLDQTKPDAVFIGIPPVAHGDIERECCKRSIHMFIEKPLSCEPPALVESLRDSIAAKPDLIVSVGYMLRYHKAVDFMKETLEKNGLKPINISARYNSAYVSIPKNFWWDSRRSGGPIVEQATHFCDLARYFGGEVDIETVVSTVVGANSPMGELSAVPAGVEDGVPAEFRINRATNAIWNFKSGGIGVLQHALLMKGTRYFTEFEIWADGAVLKLIDPYSEACQVQITRHDGASETTTIHSFPDDDPYLTEDRVFLKAIQTGDRTRIKSSYQDAANTYLLSWKIRPPR